MAFDSETQRYFIKTATLANVQRKPLVALFTRFYQVKQVPLAASVAVVWTDECWKVAALTRVKCYNPICEQRQPVHISSEEAKEGTASLMNAAAITVIWLAGSRAVHLNIFQFHLNIF